MKSFACKFVVLFLKLCSRLNNRNGIDIVIVLMYLLDI